MGATIIGNMLYIDKKLDDKLSSGERRVLIAHELGHYLEAHKFFLSIVVIFFFWCPALVNTFKRWLEYRADFYALKITKDYASFISLMDKLEHNNNTHPAKSERILMALTMRGHQ